MLNVVGLNIILQNWLIMEIQNFQDTTKTMFLCAENFLEFSCTENLRIFACIKAQAEI